MNDDILVHCGRTFDIIVLSTEASVFTDLLQGLDIYSTVRTRYTFCHASPEDLEQQTALMSGVHAAARLCVVCLHHQHGQSQNQACWAWGSSGFWRNRTAGVICASSHLRAGTRHNHFRAAHHSLLRCVSRWWPASLVLLSCVYITCWCLCSSSRFDSAVDCAMSAHGKPELPFPPWEN